MDGLQFVGKLVEVQHAPPKAEGAEFEPFANVTLAGTRWDGEPFWFRAAFVERRRDGQLTNVAAALADLEPGEWVALGVDTKVSKANKPYYRATNAERLGERAAAPTNGAKKPVAAKP